MLETAGESVRVVGDQVVIRHVYSERQVYPLNLYLREMSTEKAVAAAIDWGWAIKDLAAANVPVLVKSRGPDFDFNTTGPLFEKGQMAPVRRPAAFSRAGCQVSILPYRRGISLSGLAGRDLATLHVDAAFAVRGGMSNEDALKAITLNPARTLRVDDRLGSLEKGKDADLLILLSLIHI